MFEKCNSTTYEGPGECKSDEDIKLWLARKFVVINMNQIRFSTAFYDDQKVTREARFVWIPFNTQLREEIVYKVQLTDLDLQDSLYQFSGLTEEVSRIFSNVQHTIRPYEFPDNVHL